MRHLPTNNNVEELRRVFNRIQERVEQIESGVVGKTPTSAENIQGSSSDAAQSAHSGAGHVQSIVTFHIETKGTVDIPEIDEDGAEVMKIVMIREVAN